MLSVVVVSWNVAPLLRRCLAAVFASAPGRALDVWVVDNASRDESVAMVRRAFPQAQLIANATNRGYAAAVNQGLRACRGWAVLLLNPDAELQGDALEVMACYLETHPNVGIVGPRLVYPDGRTQPSRRRFPTLATALCESTPIQRFWPNHPAVHRYYVADQPDDAAQEVDWLVGAALLVRRSAIAEIGLLDEGFPVYWEETDWQRRLRRAGWRVCYLPQARVLHHEAQSTSQARLQQHLWFQQGKVRYFAKHHGPAVAALVRAALVVSYIVQLAEESLKYLLVPRKRPQRRPYLAVLAATLRALLRPGPATRAGDASPPARQDSTPDRSPSLSLPRSPAALPAAARVDGVPQEYQHDEGALNACGPYALSMLVNAWRPGATRGATLAATLRGRLPGPRAWRGATPPWVMVWALRRRGLRVAGGAGGRLDDLRATLAAGCPALVLVRPTGGGRLARHYRVAVGYDDAAGLLHFNDPALPPARRQAPGNLSLSYEVFAREWEAGGFGPLWRRWYLAVGPGP